MSGKGHGKSAHKIAHTKSLIGVKRKDRPEPPIVGEPIDQSESTTTSLDSATLDGATEDGATMDRKDVGTQTISEQKKIATTAAELETAKKKAQQRWEKLKKQIGCGSITVAVPKEPQLFTVRSSSLSSHLFANTMVF
jgi:hypothetical protein